MYRCVIYHTCISHYKMMLKEGGSLIVREGARVDHHVQRTGVIDREYMHAVLYGDRARVGRLQVRAAWRQDAGSDVAKMTWAAAVRRLIA